jgi:peptidoglycan/xylan/chitin deacetylase (PgdA/CDA1 family)
LRYLAIRDDDLCFFTQPQAIEALYGPIFSRVPVSFACVSRTVPQHRDKVFFSRSAAAGYYPLGDNGPLVDYVRRLLRKRQCEVMVHGYTHEYREVNGRWRAECIWKPAGQLNEEIVAGRDYLTKLFGVGPRVFVPPSNSIGRAGVEAVAAAGLDLSALLSLRPNRPWSRRYASCYKRRWSYRIARGRPYPFTLDFGTHRELVAYALYTSSAFDHVMACLRACAQEDAPFVVSTHYWQLAEDAGLYSALLRVIDAALDLGYLPATVPEAIAGRRYPPNIPNLSDRAHANSAH